MWTCSMDMDMGTHWSKEEKEFEKVNCIIIIFYPLKVKNVRAF
jgi:hypothetical protein